MFPIIAARATAVGSGALSVIRVSGAGCHILCAQFFDLKEYKIRYAHYCNFIDPVLKLKIDDVVVVFFVAPGSYTGEEAIEFSCHGGLYVAEKILTVLYTHSVMPAAPGEFTRRAVLNGRMDLTQAEGVKALVESVSEQEWESGRALLDGGLKEKISTLRAKVVSALAFLEARIDFPDEGDVVHVQLDDVAKRVREVEHELRNLKETYRDGKVAHEGLKIAIVGPPNSGKSTLLNFLLKKNRAIVSDVAGTTRDYIEEKCLIKGRLFRLFDTAGIRETSEEVEKIGISLSFEIAEQADLILLLHDGIGAFHASELKEVLKVQTKMDLTKVLLPGFDVGISCKTGEHCDELLDRIVEACDVHLKKVKGFVRLANERQFSAIDNALRFIEKFWLVSKLDRVDECLAFELQESVRSLEALIGVVTNDHVLDKIFSEFCVGK